MIYDARILLKGCCISDMNVESKAVCSQHPNVAEVDDLASSIRPWTGNLKL